MSRQIQPPTSMSTHNDIYATQEPQPVVSNYSGNAQNGPHQQPHYNYYEQQAQQGGGCAGFIMKTVIILVVVFFCLFVGMIMVGSMVVAMNGSMEQFNPTESSLSERYILGDRTATQKIAVITVNGMIAGSEDGFIAKQIRQATKDLNVSAVVLRIESPGGTMAGSDYYYHLLKEMKDLREIPVIVSMGSMAASGGYYIAMAGDEIYAEPSTITGSIGVIVSLYNAAELMEKIGVEATPITSGPLKTMGSFSKPLTEEERAVWQRLVDSNFNRFKQVIREGRKAFADEPAKLDKLATGQVFAADEAKEKELVDEIGYLDDAIKKAMDRAGLTENNSKAIRYRPKRSLMEAMMEARSPERMSGGLPGVETLVDATTPRLYLLCPQVVPIQGMSSDR